METLEWLLPLGTGTTEDVFQAEGNFPEQIDVFISFVSPRAILTAVYFNIVVDMRMSSRAAKERPTTVGVAVVCVRQST